MKRILVLAGAFAIGASAFGQATEERKERLPRGDERLKTELKLTDEQYASLKDVQKKYAQKQRELNKERERDINALLTPDQKTKLSELKEDQAKKRHANMEFRTAERLARLKSDLSLSDAQVQKLKTENESFHAKMKALRANPGADRSDIQKLKNEHQLAVKTILTEEQMQKWMQRKKRK